MKCKKWRNSAIIDNVHVPNMNQVHEMLLETGHGVCLDNDTEMDRQMDGRRGRKHFPSNGANDDYLHHLK